MRITKAYLHEQAEQAFAVVWWFRTDPAEPVAKPFLDEVEMKWPGLLAGLDRNDGVDMLRWEGRLGTLRHLSALAHNEGWPETWDGEGAFDS